MDDHSESPIIVTGCARSGTSLVAGILAHCGAWTGKVTGPTQWNRRGQFENEQIRDGITKPFLKSIGCDPMGQDKLPDLAVMDLQSFAVEWKEKVLSVITSQGYRGKQPWMVKGAKASLIWPVWASAFPEARWVVVRRKDEKIIDSCMRTSFMRKRKDRESWQEWVNHHKECFRGILEVSGERSNQVWSDMIVRAAHHGDYRIPKTLVHDLSLKWDEQTVTDFIDPQLWHC